MKNAMFTGKVNVRFGGRDRSRFQVRIGIPMGHHVLPEVSRVFRVVPPKEVTEFAQDMLDVLNNIMTRAGGARLKKASRKYPKKLNSRQRRMVGL